MKRKILIIGIVVIVAVIAGVVAWQRFFSAKPVACTMEAKLCSDGSYVGRTGPKCEFTPCLKEDLIQVESPIANGIISSPLIVKGKARGLWFFEASFPIFLTDWDGKIIAQGNANAQGDWMTTDFVPFSGTLEFEKPAYGERGFLILKKDNPSGLPKNDDALEIPVFFQSLVGGDRDEHGCIGSAGYSWCEPKQKCLRMWEESCYPSDEVAIKELFSEKYNKPLSDIFITITKDTGTHMVGGVLFGQRGVGEGGNFLAVKTEGEWKIVFDGNGGVSCKSLEPYNFPQDMIKNLCY